MEDITITDFNGLTDEIDKFTAEVPLIILGQIVYKTGEFTETNKKSKKFKAEFTFSGGVTKEEWKIADISNSTGSGEGSYIPSTARVKGMKNVNGYTASLENINKFDLEENNGWYYLKGGSLNIVFQTYQDGKAYAYSYDEKGGLVRKTLLTKETYEAWQLFKDDLLLSEKEINILTFEIDGDYNRDGVPVSDPKESEPVYFLKDKGMVVLVNCDDDNGDKEPDCKNNKIDGESDKNDMGKLNAAILNKGFISKIKSLKYRLKLELKIVSTGNGATSSSARLFPELDKPGDNKFTFSSSDDFLKILLNNDKLEMLLEGVDFSEEVIVKGELKVNALGREPAFSLGTDEVRILTSPWIGLSNAAQVKLGDGNNKYMHVGAEDMEAFKLSMNAIFGVSNIEWYGAGAWMQDRAEFGYTRTALGQVNKKSQGGVLQFYTSCFKSLISENKGWYDLSYMGSHGGGIDFSIPDENNTTSFGKAIYGNRETYMENAKAFFCKQKLQFPGVELDTKWLTIGHVDEVMVIIPIKHHNKYIVLVGDLEQAVRIIKDFDTYPAKPENEIQFPFSSCYVGTRQKLIEYYDNPKYSENIRLIQSHLDGIANTIGKELPDCSVVRIPVAYTINEYNNIGKVRCSTLLPNSVNSVVVNIGGKVKIGVPDPFFNPILLEIERILNDTGINYSNDWAIISNVSDKQPVDGNAHCATNTDKDAPELN